MSRLRPLCALRSGLGFLGESVIRLWLRLCGRKVRKADAPWLDCPMGPRGRIGEDLYRFLAEREELEICPELGVGLLPDFDRLAGPDFDSSQIRAEVRHFYEHTSLYHLEAWSEANPFTRLFLWVLVTFVSRRMDQLNFPVSALETSGGITSDILPLRDRDGRTRYTGWLRKLASSGRVVYAGLYTTGSTARRAAPCVKVTFPVPLGSATVFLVPVAGPDGSLELTSQGRRFGDPGFYRMLEVDDEHWKVRYLRTLREHFRIYVDDAGVLRTDHKVRFLGLTVLRLHYKMVRVPPEANGISEEDRGAPRS